MQVKQNNNEFIDGGGNSMKFRQYLIGIFVGFFVMFFFGGMLCVSNTATVEEDEEVTYHIVNESVDVELNYQNPNRHYMTFPVDGEIEFSSRPSYSIWKFDESSNLSKWATEYSGPITRGTHFMELEDNARTSDDKATLIYTYYPRCTVYYMKNGNKSVLTTFLLQADSESLVLPSIEVEKGYTFQGWYLDGELTEKITCIDKNVGKDYILYPKITANKYTITYYLNGGTNNEKNITEYTVEDETFYPQTPEKTHYDFCGWYSDEELTKKITAVDVSQCKNVALYAKWVEHKYSINYVNSSIPNNPKYYSISDEVIQLCEPIREGAVFEGWYQDQDFETPVYAISFCNGGDITVYAKWKLLEYSVNYVLDDGINSEQNIVTYNVEDSKFILQNPSKKNYDFVGWYTDAAFTNKITEVDTSLCRDITLYAKWEKHKYKINYINGGTHSNSLNYVYTDKEIELTKAIRDGYVFLGWYADSMCTEELSVINVDSFSECSDITIYGKWKLLHYSVNYELDGGINRSENITRYTVEDADFLLREPTKENYDFVGWYVDGDYTQKITRLETERCEDMNLYAKWKPHPYSIKYVDSYSHRNPNFYTVTDKVIQLKDAIRDGYMFEGWYTDETMQNRIYAIDVTNLTEYAEIVLYAKWNKQTYSIITKSADVKLNYVNPNRHYMYFSVAGKIEFSSSPSYARWGFDCTPDYGILVSDFPTTITAGQHFVELEDNAHTYNDTATITYTYYPLCTVYYMDGAKTVKLMSYYLEKEHKEQRLCTADFRGYELVGWYTDKTLLHEIKEVDVGVGKDWYIYPKKIPLNYYIRYELDGGINASENPISYTVEDEDIRLAEPIKEGYSFVRWYQLKSGNKVTVTNVSTKGCSNVILYAEWREEVTTPTPITTEAPTKPSIISKVPTVAEVPHNTPIVSITPTATNVPTVTQISTATNVPTFTNLPTVTNLSTVTKLPTATNIPTITNISVVTNVPIVTKIPTITSVRNITAIPLKIQKKSQTIIAKNITKTYTDKFFNIGAKTDGNGKLIYASANKNIATVSANGKVIIKGCGKTVITVKASETKEYKEAEKKITITVKPAKQKVSSVKSSRKTIIVKWEKDSKATGYILQYTTDKNFKKGVKSVTISSNKTTSKKISKLRLGKKYYVRVSSYKKVSRIKLQGDYSTVKYVEVKK